MDYQKFVLQSDMYGLDWAAPQGKGQKWEGAQCD